MLLHPAEMVSPRDLFDFNELVKTWLQAGHRYWIDNVVDRKGPVRLTSVQTGRYVLFGQRTEGRVLTDEMLMLTVPGPEIRVRLAENNFTVVSLAHINLASREPLGFIVVADNDVRNLVPIAAYDIRKIREMQHDAISESIFNRGAAQ